MSNNHSAGVKRAAGRINDINRDPSHPSYPSCDELADIIAEETGVEELIENLTYTMGHLKAIKSLDREMMIVEIRFLETNLRGTLAKYGGK